MSTPHVHPSMETVGPAGTSMDVTWYRERIAGTWASGDPLVLAFAGDGSPVVAELDGELRYLSTHVDRPRRVDGRDLEKFMTVRGPPQVLSLSEHPAGYEALTLRKTAV